MTSQVKSHDPITTRQRRHPLKPALGIAHRSVQEQDRVGLAPRIGKVVDVIGKPKSVRRVEGAIHLFLVPGGRNFRTAGCDGLTDGCSGNQLAFASWASARREAHPHVASRIARAHARSYSSRLIHSSMVCGSFWPAPKVTVGTPWRTIQFASSPPFAVRIAGVPPTLDTAATARLTTGRLSFMRNG